ncbi:GntR family transcriptional regulator [Cellulosimicrobium sp. Marseille-Q8652]
MPELRVRVDLGSGVAPYEQIRTQVVAHVAAGRLAPGDRLPTIRALATDLGLAPGTVARAYRELEESGVVTTRRRAGTVVSEGVSPADVDARRAARDLVATARASGLSDEEVLALVVAALRHEQTRAEG